MIKKILIFGLSGTLVENYSIKSRCAGKAMSKLSKIFFNIKKPIKFFSEIYIETSGMNSLKQFEIGYKKIVDKNKISKEILKKTEIEFRKNLEIAERKIKLNKDVQKFLINNKNKYIFVISTTVPIEKISKLIIQLNLNKYFSLICARNGFWENGKIHKLKNFDKGIIHFNFILNKLNQTKNNLISISSTKIDIINATKYNITSIALENIFDKKYLKELNPNYTINDFNKLNKLLKKLTKLD